MDIAGLDPGLALAAIAVLVIAGVGAIWLVPKRQARRWRDAGVDDAKLAELENSARGTLVQLVGGVALILTFVATWAQIADTRQASEETLKLTEAQQRNDRFIRAMDQLASRRPEIRVGAIAGLGGIARESAAHREPVVQVLVAFLRNRRPRTKRLPSPAAFPTAPDCSRPSKTLTAAPAETQAAVSVIVAHADLGRRQYNLSGLDFTALDAAGANFGGANLKLASFSFASVDGARFANADVGEADFFRACARGASFRGAAADYTHFIQTDLSRADFRDADLQFADLPGARLDGASFYDANLAGANLVGATLDGASLAHANLRGADLNGSTITQRQMEGTTTNACTRLPWRPRVSARCGPVGSKA